MNNESPKPAPATLPEAIALTESKPIEIKVSVTPQNWIERKLWRVHKKNRILTISPCTLGTGMRLSEIFSKLDIEFFDIRNAQKDSYQLVETYQDLVITAICIAVRNYKGRYSKHLQRFIKNNFSNESLYRTLIVVQNQMQMELFVATLYTLRGIDILSPEKPPAQENSKEQV